MQTIQIVQMLVGTLTTAIGFPLLCYQLWLNRRQAKYQALTELHRQVLLSPMRDGLRCIYTRDKNDDQLPPFNTLERDGIELVLETYDLVGFRIAENVLPKAATLETEWSVVWRVWHKMETFVLAERKRRLAPYYKVNLERLAQAADRYRQEKNYPEPQMLRDSPDDRVQVARLPPSPSAENRSPESKRLDPAAH